MLLNSNLNNRYQVLEKLGQGGMGDVYKGLDTQTNGFVAIKQLRSTINEDPTVLERFRREGQALRDLNHPNIVKMLDMIEQESEYYLVTEYISGGDLAILLRQRGKLSVEESLKMGMGLADALSRAHQLGIVHRDIKPANVLIAADGSPRLTDFGVAHLESEERLTGTGMSVGTLDYLPPEVATGQIADARADVWSFGVMVYEMLTGRRPFQGTTTFLLLNSILKDEPSDLLEFCPEAPSALEDLLKQMLQKDRNARIRSARQVGAAMESILDGDEAALLRLKTPVTPVTPISPQVIVMMDDSPTAIATPTLPQQTSANSPTISAAKESSPAVAPITPTKAPNWTLLVAIVALVLATIFGTLVFSNMLQATAPTETPSPTNTSTPEPSPTAMPITSDAPEGYRWTNLDELSYLMPSSWGFVPLQMAMTLGSNFTPNQDDLDAGMSLIEAQRKVASYVNGLTGLGVAVMIQDTGFVLPEEALIDRLAGRNEESAIQFETEGEYLDLPIGRTLVFSAVPSSDGEATPFFIEFYNVYNPTSPSLYTLIFAGPEAQFEEQRETINAILNSLQIVEISEEEATAEATSEE
jgi:serine/threonine protein kinase